jgi:AcrR family transcriptional regulator
MKKKATAKTAADAGRSRLLRVAMRLFADRGFDGVTVRDIASAAGVSVGLINHHFGSKAGLREAVDASFMAQFEELLSADLPEVRGLEPEATLQWLDRWIDRHIDNWGLSTQYMRRALLEGSEWGAAIFERFFRFIRRSVDIMDAQGRIRPDVDRLWLPLLVVYLDLGTLLLDPYVEKVLGRSGFEKDLWRRRYRAYLDLIWRGAGPAAEQPKPATAPVVASKR